MSRFYVPKENVRKDEIMIEGEEAHHILDVMRLQEGNKVVVFDGTGNEYTGFIKTVNKQARTMSVEIVKTETPAAESIPEITFAQALPERNKMEYVIEKATELGVSHIVPLISERTIVRPDEASCRKKVERWQKIVGAASKQCGRTSIPEVKTIIGYHDMVSRIDQYDLALLACLEEETSSIREMLSGFKSGKILVFVGPEGGFSPEEIRMADRDNCRMVTLGRRILKSDTAGLFILSVLNYEFSL
jgi:16S rRNA (uracil1498-N3)-methyltransferase